MNLPVSPIFIASNRPTPNPERVTGALRIRGSGEPLGKAGAYGIQGLGGALIESITGSYSGIMGLPLYETAQLLTQAKVSFALNHTNTN